LLAQYALGWDATQFFTSAVDPAPAGFAERYAPLVVRRVSREPLAYITGTKEFWNLTFDVSPAVLIPRPETELLIEAALERLPAGSVVRIADVCTGSGCIAIALAHERTHARVVASDISPAALEVAGRNAVRLQVADRVDFVHADLLQGVSGRFDLIVSNPPYVPDRARPALQPEVRDYEPAVALFGGDDGLSTMGRLVAASLECLERRGTLMFEFSAGQDDAVDEMIARTAGLKMVDIRSDLQGIPRVAIVTRA
jgi:release factor glutamine methyltransferase